MGLASSSAMAGTARSTRSAFQLREPRKEHVVGKRLRDIVRNITCVSHQQSKRVRRCLKMEEVSTLIDYVWLLKRSLFDALSHSDVCQESCVSHCRRGPVVLFREVHHCFMNVHRTFNESTNESIPYHTIPYHTIHREETINQTH